MSDARDFKMKFLETTTLTTRIESLTADQILSFNNPEKLFSGETEVEHEYRTLSRKWHPDKNPAADPTIQAKINILYQEALLKVGIGAWDHKGVISLELTNGKKG